MSASKEEESASASWDPSYRERVQEMLVTGTKFVVDKKYKIIKPIGHGAYGVVVYVWCVCRARCCCGRTTTTVA